MSANLILAYVVFRRPLVQRLVEGEARILIRDGQVLSDSLRKELLTEQDLLSAVRRSGLEEFADVHLAVSEANGMIGVIPMEKTARVSPQ